ncbi:MAG: SDR family NAD(P)-dependent oxidoreductase [Phenylobacterium sp.]
MKLQDKVAIVTGGSQGIGQAIAERLAADGTQVAVVARGLERAQAVAAGIVARGGVARAYGADCSLVPEIDAVVAKVVADFGGLDIVVGNAGAFRTMPLEETTEAVWDEQLDLNLKGTFFLVKAAVPHLERRGGGKVVLISSIAGVRAFPNCAAYCASKGGLVNLTKALSVELAARRINVNTIAPGNVETPINEHLRGPDHDAYVKLMSDRTPTGRAFLKPTDIAGAAAYLVSEDAIAMHGGVMVVDDGWCAW